MIQEIITYLILGLAVILSIRWIWKSIFPTKKGCSGCASAQDCGGCPLDDLKREIEEVKKRQTS